MPVFETPSGRRMELQLPPTEWPEMQKAKENYERLKAEERATRQRLGSLRRKREAAVQADRVALGQALKEGKADPGEAKVDQIDKETLACNRRLEALEIALDNAEAEVIEVIDLHRDEWLQEVSEKVDTAYARYAEAVEALTGAADAVAYGWALFRWVRFFPEEEISFRSRGGYITGLKAPHGDPYTSHEVLEALRADAQRRENTKLEVVLGNE